jgi:hypothetical protein
MHLELHPEAAKNLDAKAEELLTKLAPDPHVRRRRPEGSFVPDIVIHEISEDAVLEVIETGYVNPLGREIAKTFPHDTGVLGLFGEDYKDLVRLAEVMQKAKTLRDKVSVGLLTDLIFKWIADRHRRVAELPMTGYVLGECEKQLLELEIWLPVAMLQIQSDIQIGRVTLRTITKEMIDAWHEPIKNRLIEEFGGVDPQAQLSLDEERSDLQGFAAATVSLHAEPQRASEIASEEAERALAMLRLFSPANRLPEVVSYCTLLGKEHVEETKELVVQGGRIINYSAGSADPASPFWALGNRFIDEIGNAGLVVLSDLLAQEKRTEFQEALLDSLRLYSKCPLMKDPADKLIAILVALESMLLKDGSEPIQQNLAERIAFLFEASAGERREMKAKIIRAYGLRSSFIHHGRGITTDEMDALREFMMVAWTSFYALIRFSQTFATKAEMFDMIEERKMS